MGTLLQLGLVDLLADRQLLEHLRGERLVLDIDVVAGESGGEAGVLALLADGQAQLVVGDDDRGIGVVGVGIHDDARDLGGRQSRSDALRGIIGPQHDVHALTAELGDDRADTAALGSDAGADGVETVIERAHGHLGADTGIARDRADLDDAVIHLGHLELEEALDEVWVRARDHDGGAGALTADGRLVAIGVADVDDDRLEALVVHVALALRAFVALVGITALVEMRQLRLDAFADLDDREVGRGLQHRAGDDVADAVGELLVDLLARGVAHDGVDLRLRMLGGDAARVLGGHVLLVELGVLAGLGVGLAHGDELVHVDLARLRVHRHARAVLEVHDVGVALGQRLLELADQVHLVDVLLLAERHQRFHHLGCHLRVFLSLVGAWAPRLFFALTVLIGAASALNYRRARTDYFFLPLPAS